MTLSEKSAYLKGLMEGLHIDTEKAEGKMLAAMVDMLEDVAYSMADLEEDVQSVVDHIDEMDEELELLDDTLFGEDEEEDDEDFDFGDEDELYEVKCPSCGEVITVTEGELDDGAILCPQCGETLEFDMDDDSEEEDDSF